MNWASAADFWAMGGYGAYVWGAYGVTLAVMLAEPLLVRRRCRQALAESAGHRPDPILDQKDDS
jgi:heme exporter protein D